MSTGKKLRLSFVLRCAWPVFGVSMLLAAGMPVQAAPSAYVANFGSNTVSVIDTATNAVTATIPVGYEPFGVAVSPDGSRVYVANSCLYPICPINNDTVSVIDTASDTVTATITVGANPFGVAVSPDGSRVYVTNLGSDTVSVIGTASDTVTATISVGVGPRGVAVSPDGSHVYVANYGGNTVSVIDTATNQVTATIGVGNSPFGVAVSPDGSRVYVANDGSNTVSVIDTATNQVTGSAIPVEYEPLGVAVSPDGSSVYVANQCVSSSCTGNSTVSVIDTANDSVVTTINVGIDPGSLGAFVGPGALIATNSSASGPEGEQISGTVPALTNTTGCVTSGDTVSQDPAHGTLLFDSGTGEYTYTPSTATYVGPDAFTWNGTASSTCTAADNPTAPVSNVATVTLQLTVAPPVASDGSVTTAVGQAVTGQLDVTAPAGQTPTYAMVIGPRDGTVTLTASTGAFTYTPVAGFLGTDSFAFDAKDSGGTSNTATETVSVVTPPVASDGSVTTAEGQAVTGQLGATAPAGQILTYAVVTVPSHGAVTLSASTGAFSYIPAAGFSGTDSFTFDAEDSGVTSNTATETVSVVASPVAPDTDGGGGALGLDSLGVLGAGLLFRRSRRKRRLSPG